MNCAALLKRLVINTRRALQIVDWIWKSKIFDAAIILKNLGDLGKYMTNAIRFFFQPKNVAVIGASDKEYSWGNWIASNLIKYRTKGKVFLVNSRHETVLGEKVYKNLKELPEDIDLAVVVVPAPQVPEILKMSAERNAKVATIISAGFAETVKGQQYHAALKRIVREYDIRLQGPNCAGFYNMATPINASPLAEHLLAESPVAFITQSGYVGNSLSIWGGSRNLPIGKYISVGNEADLTISDYLEFFLQDSSVEVIMLYIEGIRDGARFKEVLQNRSTKKPILVWKASDTSAVKRAALSHTAHLTGTQGIFQGLMKQFGVIQLRRLKYGLTASYSFLRHPPLQGIRFAIMMVGAGWGIILTDSLTNAGFEVPEFSDHLKQTLKVLLPSYRVSVKNPVDYGAADTMDFGLLKRITQTVFESGEVDGFIIANIGDLSPFDERAAFLEPQIAKTLFRIQRKYQKPIYLFSPLTETDSKSVSLIKKKMNMYHTMDSLLETLQAQRTYFNYHQKSGL
ncbi:MAG: CoA-binding protein [Candidatus Helarchaeota archaeon]